MDSLSVVSKYKETLAEIYLLAMIPSGAIIYYLSTLPVTEECLRRNNETSDSVSFTKYVRWQVRHSGSVIESSPLVWLLLSSLQ